MTINRILLVVFSLFILTGSGIRENNDRTRNFPKTEIKPGIIPEKENVWVFIMAGQSNMAGRGLVEPRDTIPSERVFAINKNGELLLAKEPLNFNEPSMAGLDCGLSFGKELLEHIPDSISILLIHTAVGGSSINQWVNDSTFRNVTLLSNFREKVKTAQKYGTIKGILWHQGETDASTAETIELYPGQLTRLFSKFRNEINNLSLPIFIGELGTFSKTDDSWQAINKQIHSYVMTDKNAFVITTKDLKDKGDRVHFNSVGQRLMGQRFAKAFVRALN
ncbi:MAG: sialate O-acetylesterase [Prolixibacteraceae bacterium]|jgi:hypothetical protein|nr:sialate O-acetylesterase [Prolixibacteraceae bacterium]MDD4755625.1 sialate O-acetylesterase [Prolixibacteraceae bacterium]NLO00840.1 sialate O-acetylesterase [Bacteroidales bacterium]